MICKDMNKFIFKLWCVAALTTSIASCSTDSDGAPDVNKQNYDSPTEMINMLSQFSGKYNGVWWINDAKTEADGISYLYYEKLSQKSNVDINKRDSYPSHVRFSADESGNSLGLELGEFPFKALTKRLFPDMEAAYYTITIQVGARYDDEDKLYNSFIKEEVNAGNINRLFMYSSSLEIIGYSEKTVYFRLQSEDLAYLRMPYVVTTKDGDYFAIVLDILSDRSTVSMDIATGTMSCSFVIKQIEIYDKNQMKQVRSLDQEIKLTFISTQKI